MGNYRQTGRVGTSTQERASILTGGETERDAASRVIAEQATPEDRPTNPKSVSVAPRLCEQLLVREAVAGIPVHGKETLSKLVVETLTSGQKGVNNRLSTALETLVFDAVQKSFKSPEFVCQFLYPLRRSLGFIRTVAALIRREQRKLAAEQA